MEIFGKCPINTPLQRSDLVQEEFPLSFENTGIPSLASSIFSSTTIKCIILQTFIENIGDSSSQKLDRLNLFRLKKSSIQQNYKSYLNRDFGRIYFHSKTSPLLESRVRFLVCIFEYKLSNKKFSFSSFSTQIYF